LQKHEAEKQTFLQKSWKSLNNGVKIVELPEENELVVAIVKKIMPYGAFCSLPEYGDLESFMHVSEVAPRWIKNIHEFISEGQKHVVKVLRVDRQKNQVDISLKRVNEEEKKTKLESMRIEKKIEKILEVAIAGSKSNLTIEQTRSEIAKKYPEVYECFEEISDKGEEALEGINLPKALKEQLLELVKKNVKKPMVEVSGIAKLTCYSANGIEEIKQIFQEATKGNDKINVHYLGAPNYKMTITASNYKEGEKILTNIVQKIEKSIKAKEFEFSFDRDKK